MARDSCVRALTFRLRRRNPPCAPPRRSRPALRRVARECAEESVADVGVMTTLLESRLIAGELELALNGADVALWAFEFGMDFAGLYGVSRE